MPSVLKDDTWMWDDNAIVLDWISFSKPSRTDTAIIRLDTPIMTPITEITVINEIKPR
jgi:hypothetical protein